MYEAGVFSRLPSNILYWYCCIAGGRRLTTCAPLYVPNWSLLFMRLRLPAQPPTQASGGRTGVSTFGGGMFYFGGWWRNGGILAFGGGMGEILSVFHYTSNKSLLLSVRRRPACKFYDLFSVPSHEVRSCLFMYLRRVCASRCEKCYVSIGGVLVERQGGATTL